MLPANLATFVQGTCMEMCPKSERDLRQRERLLHPFEMKSGSEGKRPAEADPEKTVKEYSRSAAGHAAQKASELRPLPVLDKTTHYLIELALAHTKSTNWNSVYDFVADRLRAVRKDLVVQGLSGEAVLPILEPMVLFHVYAGYRLCECKPAVFDQKLNNDLLMDSLRRILDIYDFTNNKTPRRGIFESIFALRDIHSPEGLLRLISLPRSCRSPTTSKAVELAFAFSLGNYARVFRLTQNLPPPLTCILNQHFPSMRRTALLAMTSAYSSKVLKVPADYLARIFLMDRADDVVSEAKNYGINCAGDQIHFQRGSFNLQAKLVPLTQLPKLNVELRMEEYVCNFIQK